jgi:hypothetical protein
MTGIFIMASERIWQRHDGRYQRSKLESAEEGSKGRANGEKYTESVQKDERSNFLEVEGFSTEFRVPC